MSKHRTESILSSFTPSSFVVLGISGAAGFALYKSNLGLQGDVTQLSKLLYALRWQLASCSTLLFCIGRTGSARGKHDAIDPLNTETEPLIVPYNRCLQNTLEQLVVSVPAQLVLSTYLKPENLKIIPGLVLLFVTGRALFIRGYPDKRGPGFMMTVFPTMALYAANLYFMVTSGPTFGL